MMPDVNAVIRRDQARWFTDASLKPMRGSCRQYMMYGEYSSLGPDLSDRDDMDGDGNSCDRCAILGALVLF